MRVISEGHPGRYGAGWVQACNATSYPQELARRSLGADLLFAFSNG